MAGPATPRVLGRYVLHGEIAAGGMAAVHLGRLLGPVGFSRTVAIKRLHPQFAKDPEFVAMFLDEARIAARIRHPNVVPTLDVVASEGELFLVMDYVEGESLARLVRAARRRGAPPSPRLVVAVIVATLQGLHAAHEAKGEQGQPLGIVHRDVSPQNVLVGVDGVARVLDFGVAKALGRSQVTREGQLKGKLPYMAPEQIRRRGVVTRQTDVYAASVVLWEALAARRLFDGDDEAQVLAAVLDGHVEPPSQYAPGITPALDALVLRGLAHDPATRFATARDMALALEACVAPATTGEISAWVTSLAGDALETRATWVHAIESNPDLSEPTLALPRASQPSHPSDEVLTDSDSATTRIAHASQASSVSLATPASTFTRPSSRIPYVVAAVVVLAIASVAVITWTRGPHVDATTGSPARVDDTASVSGTGAGTGTATGTGTAAGTGAGSGTATASATVGASTTVTTTAKTAKPPATIKKPPPPATGACNPPFYYDNGIKKFKPECI
ncbi:MAG: serine/threonine-protein kinase [Polyangiales bacterium]